MLPPLQHTYAPPQAAAAGRARLRSFGSCCFAHVVKTGRASSCAELLLPPAACPHPRPEQPCEIELVTTCQFTSAWTQKCVLRLSSPEHQDILIDAREAAIVLLQLCKRLCEPVLGQHIVFNDPGIATYASP